MSDFPELYRYLANGVLVLHVGIVLFILGGLLLTLIGRARQWRWVRNFHFRTLHLLAIACVAMEAWAGIVCPLTTLEQWLRQRAGQVVYEGDFVAFWLSKLLFYQAEPWIFIAAYSIFGLLVLLSWFLIPPTLPKRGSPLTH
ncbi:MAG: DUF2784 domain-containing protein [Pseudomonadota bacterium]